MPYIGRSHVAGDHISNFKVLDDISSYTATFDGSSTNVVSTANETLRIVEHRFIQGQRVTYTNGGGGNIGGLTTGTAYFVTFDTHNTIKLATTLANANSNTNINLSSVGSGSSHTLTAAFDGVNQNFKATHSGGSDVRINNSTQLQIAINNVIQKPNNISSYTEGFRVVDSEKIQFKNAPTSNDVFWGTVIANTIETFDISDNKVDNLTGDGSTTEFNLSSTPPNNNSIVVTINGVVQHPSDANNARAYSLNNQLLIFTSAPANGDEIQVRHIGFAGASTGDVTGFYGRVGNVVLGTSDNISVGNVNVGAGSSIAVGTGVTIESNGQATYTGVVTALQFKGDGSNLTGIDATALKDTSGNVKIQAQASGAVYTGVHTFTTLKSTSADFSGSVSIGGTLTYEDVTNIDSVGLVTARSGVVSPYADIDDFISVGSNIHLGNAGVVTATTFKGDGDFVDLDVDGHTNLDNVSIAGVTTFASNIYLGDNDRIYLGADNDMILWHTGGDGLLYNNTGGLYIRGANNTTLQQPILRIRNDGNTEDIAKFTQNAGVELYYDNIKRFETSSTGIKVGTGVTIETNGQATFVGVVTFGSGSTTINNNVVNVGTALTLGHTQGLQFHTQNLHSAGFEVNQINVSGASTIGGNLDANGDLDVDGHTNLDNVSIAGVVTATTFSGSGASLTALNIVTDTSPQLGGTLDTNNQDITFNGAQNVSWDSSAADFIFNDYAKINLGTDKDFRMYQDGNNTILQSSNTSGGVYLQGALVQVGSETGEAGVKFVKDGAIELYHDNEKMFSTNNDGAEFFDSDNNFNLYFNCNGTRRGYLFVDATGGGKMAFMDPQNHPMLEATKNGSVDLYHDNVKRFETSSTGGSLTGVLSVSSNIRVSGEIDLGTTNGNKFMDVCLGDNYGFYLRSTSGEGTNHEALARFERNRGSILYWDGNTRFETTSAGITVTGTVDSASDVILKENIKTIDNALDKVTKLRGVEYDYKENKKHSIGVIAQEVQEVLPELVNGSEQKSVAYGNIAAVLIEAIKEQNEIINKMKKEIEELKG